MLAQKFLYLTRVSCCLQAQLKWTVFLQRQENCLTSCQALSLELLKDEPQKSSEDLLCLKKHLKWKIKGQTLMSLIILIWINFYWHSQAQQTTTSEPGPELLAETHPKRLESLGPGKSVNLSRPCRGLELLQEQTPRKVFWLSCSQSQLDPTKTLMYTKITIRREWPAQEAMCSRVSAELLRVCPGAQDRAQGPCSTAHLPQAATGRLLIPRDEVGVMSAPLSPLSEESQTHKSLPHPNIQMLSPTPALSLPRLYCCVFECSKRGLIGTNVSSICGTAWIIRRAQYTKMLSSTKQGSYSAPVKAEIKIINFMNQSRRVSMHSLKGTHCNIHFFQQVKNMLKIKLQDALVF